MPSQAALLIGDITHARKEWESLSSILTLKVRPIHPGQQKNALIREGIPKRHSTRLYRQLQGWPIWGRGSDLPVQHLEQGLHLSVNLQSAS